jgi:hypothetical protein
MLARHKESLNVLYRLTDPVIEKICRLVCETILRELEAQAEKSCKLLRWKKRGGSK